MIWMRIEPRDQWKFKSMPGGITVGFALFRLKDLKQNQAVIFGINDLFSNMGH